MADSVIKGIGMIKIGQTALITTDNWFIAPNGRQYRAVFGTVKSVADSQEVLGVKTNSRSTNWYVEIGSMILAGCQIHYAVAVDRKSVNTGESWDSTIIDGKESRQMMMSRIYDADQ